MIICAEVLIKMSQLTMSGLILFVLLQHVDQHLK